MQGGPFTPLSPDFGSGRTPYSGAWQVTNGQVGAALAQTVNRVVYIPFQCGAGTWDRIAVNVGVAVASSAQRFGLYAPTSAGLPGALIADFGTAATTSTGVASVTISQPVPSGLCFIATVSQGGASGATLAAVDTTYAAAAASANYYLSTAASIIGGQLTGFFEGSVSGALPSTATVGDYNLGVPKIGYRWA